MATPFSEVIDLALITIQDYKLDKLYNKSPTDWATLLSGFIVRAVPLFDNSIVDLSYDLASQTFNNTLSNAEKNILAVLTIAVWFERTLNNLTQISNTMTPSDFKRSSEAHNLEVKSEYFDRMREKYSQLMTDYSKKNINYQNWGNGIFGT